MRAHLHAKGYYNICCCSPHRAIFCFASFKYNSINFLQNLCQPIPHAMSACVMEMAKLVRSAGRKESIEIYGWYQATEAPLFKQTYTLCGAVRPNKWKLLHNGIIDIVSVSLYVSAEKAAKWIYVSNVSTLCASWKSFNLQYMAVCSFGML